MCIYYELSYQVTRRGKYCTLAEGQILCSLDEEGEANTVLSRRGKYCAPSVYNAGQILCSRCGANTMHPRYLRCAGTAILRQQLFVLFEGPSFVRRGADLQIECLHMFVGSVEGVPEVHEKGI